MSKWVDELIVGVGLEKKEVEKQRSKTNDD
jgi:hypothetical protein